LDNAFYGVKHDGKANVTVSLSRNAHAGDTFDVTITYGGKTLSYKATAAGGVSPRDGFTTYMEDDGP
jgi:hypothetical protein